MMFPMVFTQAPSWPRAQRPYRAWCSPGVRSRSIRLALGRFALRGATTVSVSISNLVVGVRRVDERHEKVKAHMIYVGLILRDRRTNNDSIRCAQHDNVSRCWGHESDMNMNGETLHE